MLEAQIQKTLEQHGYAYELCIGCCDIVARKKEMLLIKVLENVDSLQEPHARSLHILAKQLDARPLVVGLRTRRETLRSDIIYDRFGIPTLTPETFETFLENKPIQMIRYRGGLYATVDPIRLKEERELAGLTQETLAKKMRTTKKSIYEHEQQPMKMEYAFVKRLEGLFGIDMIVPAEMQPRNRTSKIAPTTFEHRISKKFSQIGFSTVFVSKLPFNMLVEEKREVTILSSATTNEKKLEKDAPFLANFARIVGKRMLAITKEEANVEIPVIQEKEFEEISSSKELKRLIRRW